MSTLQQNSLKVITGNAALLDPAEKAGVRSIRVRDPKDSKIVIETIIACLGGYIQW
jgi:hypothetical protein